MSGWLSLLIFAMVSTVTPGPNNIMIMASGLNYGIRRSLPHWFGIFLGFPLMALGVGLGLGQAFELWPWLHSVIKVLGISYLLYLAYKIAITNTQAEDSASSNPLTFMQAVLFQWVNPKAWVMCIGAIATFTTFDISMMQQALLIAFAFVLVGAPCTGIWLFAGHYLQRFLNQPNYQRMFNYAMATLLVASLLPMVPFDAFI
ncbi:LysE family translocator [Reinekea marina]|uniref:LysE family translocator n=1 Tax=Reinekea marina TaxID=1310421 RepID=A0ABV7WM86_9GAMM|nr:LysE family translocator [Reinekea marina]MDN3650715.1 LysE family translocator [Reinekea marina]